MKRAKWMNIVGWVLTVLMGVMLIISGVFVFIGSEAISEVYTNLGLESLRQVIAVGKFATGILLLIPMTFVIGAFLALSFWGGTIVAHMTVGEPFIMQSVMVIIVWVILLLRRPDIFVYKKR